MDYYDGIVRLRSGAESGVFTGDVPKSRLSVPEILILRKLHGDDAVVVGDKVGGGVSIKHADERRRLASIYGPKVVGQLFGENWQKLPSKLPKLDQGEDDEASVEELAA